MKNPSVGEGGGGVFHLAGGNVFRGSLCFRVYFFSSGIFRASFSKDDK